MLSIDITDTRISFVCGSAKGKKVTVGKAATRELQSGCIDNGLIKDIHALAGEITELLFAEKISEKETVVMINSGMIVYKEMILPKPKKAKPEELIERMIRNDMGLANDYNFTYSIIREEAVNKVKMLRILAAACPQRLVDGYLELFKQLGLKLKAVLCGNTCVVRLFSNTDEYRKRMPLVALEVQNDYVNFNLFEDGKLTLSRFVKADPNDFQSRTDHINQLVFDNLFRIVQLFGQGSGREPVKEIVYHGFTEDGESLENSISQFNIPVSRFEKPAEIIFKPKGEPSEYAGPTGSLYLINKKTENINLLYSFKYRDKAANFRFFANAVCIFLLCAGLLGGGIYYLNFHLNQRKLVLGSYNVEYEMLRPSDLITEKSDLLNAIATFNTYSEKVELARELFYFQPKMVPDILSKLRKSLLPGMQINGNVTVNDYDVTAYFFCKSEDQPSRYTEALTLAGYFESIDFSGYQRDEDGQYSFKLVMKIKGGNRFEIN